MLILAIVVLWILCGILCNKIDSMFSRHPTYSYNFILGLCIWPLIVFFLLRVKHRGTFKGEWHY